MVSAYMEVPSHVSGSYDIELTHDLRYVHEMHSVILSLYN